MILLAYVEGSNARPKFVGGGEDQGKINIGSLVCPKIFSYSQGLGMTNHFIDGSKAKLRHNSSELIGYIVKEVNDVFWRSLELLAQLWVLCGNANRASILYKSSASLSFNKHETMPQEQLDGYLRHFEITNQMAFTCKIPVLAFVQIESLNKLQLMSHLNRGKDSTYASLCSPWR
jgi:hypothetical protein